MFILTYFSQCHPWSVRFLHLFAFGGVTFGSLLVPKEVSDANKGFGVLAGILDKGGGAL